jgi:hypothetical protein
MGKEYKTNENFKHLYRLLANPMENKEAIIDIMQQYGKKIPKVLKEKTKKTRTKKSIGGIMGGRVGLKAMQDLIEDDEEEFAQGGRIGYAGGPKKMNQDGLEFIVPVGQSEEMAFYNAIINDVDGIMSDERKSEWLNLLVPQLMESGEMSGAEKDELGMAQGGRIGAFGGGVMGIGVPGMRLPGIPRMAPDGIEFDMRAGGFQNLGAQEGKDDVNAKLAKNEFVMTADAVRGAGGGSIEKGAQRMYDTMKKLESKVG